MHLQSVLEKIGYQPQEASLYLACLELGEATASELSHKTDLPRTSVLELLGNMQKKGMVSSYNKQTHKYWVGENPEKLLASFQESESELSSILPQLKNLGLDAQKVKPVVKVFTGIKEIKLIMDDILETKHHISALISWDDWIDFFGEEYIQDFIERRYKRFLKIRIIMPHTVLAEGLKDKNQEQLRQSRFLLPNIDLKRISNFIYGTKIAIISMNKKVPTGIVIDDPDVVHANMVYFDNLWEHSAK